MGWVHTRATGAPRRLLLDRIRQKRHHGIHRVGRMTVPQGRDTEETMADEGQRLLSGCKSASYLSDSEWTIRLKTVRTTKSKGARQHRADRDGVGSCAAIRHPCEGILHSPQDRGRDAKETTWMSAPMGAPQHPPHCRDGRSFCSTSRRRFLGTLRFLLGSDHYEWPGLKREPRTQVGYDILAEHVGDPIENERQVNEWFERGSSARVDVLGSLSGSGHGSVGGVPGDVLGQDACFQMHAAQ